ncbi:MAG: hypothetical protein WC776_05555 [Patescibacteria group bacterium]
MLQTLIEDYSDFRSLARLIEDAESGDMDVIDQVKIKKRPGEEDVEEVVEEVVEESDDDASGCPEATEDGTYKE